MTIALVVNGETVGEYAFADVSLEGDDISTITDAQVKARVARHRDENETQYDDYVVDRFTGETGERNFVIRKRATYGGPPCPACGCPNTITRISIDDENHWIVIALCTSCGYEWQV